MPTYTYECSHCNTILTKFSTMRDHRNTIQCECGQEATQIIVSPPMMIIPQDCYYESPIDGRPITNRKHRVEDMARSGCIEYDPGIRQDVDRALKESEAILDKSIDETVERTIEEMPVIKKERLAAELAAGDDIKIVRSTMRV